MRVSIARAPRGRERGLRRGGGSSFKAGIEQGVEKLCAGCAYAVRDEHNIWGLALAPAERVAEKTGSGMTANFFIGYCFSVIFWTKKAIG